MAGKRYGDVSQSLTGWDFMVASLVIRSVSVTMFRQLCDVRSPRRRAGLITVLEGLGQNLSQRYAILNTGVHALAPGWAMDMRRIATERIRPLRGLSATR